MLVFQPPLTDITNVQPVLIQKQPKPNFTSALTNLPPKIHRHDPYGWRCLTGKGQDDSFHVSDKDQNDSIHFTDFSFQDREEQAFLTEPFARKVIVQFKCHRTEYSASMSLEKGQYVVVQGDRGIDIGVVVRVNEDKEAAVESTEPIRNVLRHATQREVDYWAHDLKEAELHAIKYCQTQVGLHQLDMSIVHGEYQFDKKKLTFYYESQRRIDFVQLLKELYKEFGCRIWMEKVPVCN